MSALIPFESTNLPAHIANAFRATGHSPLSSGVGVSYPIVSIKGKVFHIVRGDERTLVTKPGDDEPAASIEAVLIDANPALSKVYYPNGYEEGSTDKPTCYSNDGIAPAADAGEPQAKKCAACPHNVFGSRITENGKKGKACSDSRRLAIVAGGAPGEPMLLRVPAASLRPLAEYGDMLDKRGVNFRAVMTKIGFDYTVAHPALTFKPLGFIDAKTAATVLEVYQSDIVKQITGAGATMEPEERAAVAEEKAAPQPEPKPESKPEKPKAAAKPKAEPKVVEPPAEPPVMVNEEVAADIERMVGEINFDL